MQVQMGYAEDSGVSGRQGLGTAGLGGRFQTGFHGSKRQMTPLRRAPRLWAHAGWASSNANISWRRRAGAMGGGTEASLRWRKIRVITDSWVMAAMMRREPRRQNGQVAISTAKTRPSS